MSRTKQPRTVLVRYVGGLPWVPPLKPESDIRTARQIDVLQKANKVPAIEAVEADGRTVYVTLEALHGKTDRAGYIAHMRLLAAALAAEADRLDKNPDR